MENKTKTIYKLGRQLVEVAKSYKYLGTILTNTGNFKTNEVNLKRKGIRASFLITKNIGTYSKASTAIKIFEKIIEPILMYNCEVSQAFVPKSWNLNKFKEKIWTQGEELNKVVISFLRQLLGVHRKTTNIAILAETGKYPIAIKIYTHIIKYWLRLSTSDNALLKAAYATDHENKQNGRQSWGKIVDFLLIIAALQGCKRPANQNEIRNFASNFKKQLMLVFEEWWRNQAVITGQNKLDYYYKYKRVFRYESYLDNIEKHNRIHLTRLRLSCHNLPIETQRYNKEKITREERKCDICNLNETGDEEHYLNRCNNDKIEDIRRTFFSNIRLCNPQLDTFSDKNIVDYCLSMNDHSIQLPTSLFIQNLLKTYRKQSNVPTLKNICTLYIKKKEKSMTHLHINKITS